MQDFSYDPFDPAVMADPLPYYRVLRDEHPVYYIAEVGHLRAVAVRRHLAGAGDQRRDLRRVGGNSARRNGAGAATTTARCRIRRCIPCRSTRTSTRRSTTASAGALGASSGPKSVAKLADRIRALANERLDELLPRGTLRPDPGLRRHRRRLGGVRIGRSTSRSRARRAGHGQRGQPRRSRAAVWRWPTPGPAIWST